MTPTGASLEWVGEVAKATPLMDSKSSMAKWEMVVTSLLCVLRATMGDTRMAHSTGSLLKVFGSKKSLESLPMLEETMQLVKLMESPAALASGSRNLVKEDPRTFPASPLPDSRKKAALA